MIQFGVSSQKDRPKMHLWQAFKLPANVIVIDPWKLNSQR
jgi:hypothetical protein